MLKRKTQQSRKYFNATHKRDSRGRFAKSQPEIVYYQNNDNIPEYIISSEGVREKITYRAVVTLNDVPIHSDKKRGRPRYKSFSWAKIDYYENIDIEKMKQNLMQEIANHFHCKINDLWFSGDDRFSYWGIEYPKPYRGNHWEGLEIGEY